MLNRIAHAALLAALVACGGATSEQGKNQALAPTDQPPTREACIVAVVNYDHLGALLTRTPQSTHRPGSTAYAVDRDRRVEDCFNTMTAREASCIGNAESLTEAQDCAPTKVW